MHLIFGIFFPIAMWKASSVEPHIWLNLTVKASPKGQKVILTIRDSDEVWWKSWCRFNEQEIRRDAIGSFNIRLITIRAAEAGYMGPQFCFIIVYAAYNMPNL